MHATSRTAPFMRAVTGALCVLAPALLAAQQAPAWVPALDSAITAEMARTRTPGAQIAVVVDGKLAYTRGYGVADIESGRAVTDRTLFRVGSVTKMITAATLTQLAADGKLDLQAPISRYVSELAGKQVGTVTTHQLLTNSAGWVDNTLPYGRMGEGALGEVMTVVSDTLFFTAPGRVISYSNPGYSMAGFVSERAGGARFGTLAERLVLRKMGMPRATFRPLEAMTQDFSQGHVGMSDRTPVLVRPYTENTAQWAAGFLFASAAELARFTIAIMDDGMLDGQRVLSSEAVRLMTTGHMAIPGSATARYGYGLRVDARDGQRIWQHGGAIVGFDATVLMFPDKRVSVILLDNRADAPFAGVLALIGTRVAGMPPVRPRTPPADRVGTAEERARVVGTYRQGTTSVQVIDEDGSLFVVQGGRVPARLVGEDRLVAISPNGTRRVMEIVRGPDGRVEYLHESLRALARQ